MKFWQKVSPYSKLDITVRAFTYWGSAPPTRAYLRTPQFRPSKPEAVRGYVVFETRPFHAKQIIGIFRWAEPNLINGNIRKYVVDCWYNGIDDTKQFLYENFEVDATQFELTARNLIENITYYFQVSKI